MVQWDDTLSLHKYNANANESHKMQTFDSFDSFDCD